MEGIKGLDITAVIWPQSHPSTTIFHILKGKFRWMSIYVSMTNSIAAKRTGLLSWKHLIDVHLNFSFKNEKWLWKGARTCITAVLHVRTHKLRIEKSR